MNNKIKSISISQILKSLAVTLIASLSMLINNGTYPATEQIKEQLGSRLAVMIWQIRCSFNDVDYVFTLVFILMLVAFSHLIPKVRKENLKWNIPFSAISALFILLCDSYLKTNSWDLLFASTTALFTSFLKGIGIAVVAFFVLDIINRTSIEEKNTNGKFNYKLFAALTAIMIVCWIPYMVIMAPGSMNIDARDQFAQIMGYEDICRTINFIDSSNATILLNNHHPVFHTLILGCFIKLGEAIGSYFIAIELFSVLQSIAFAASLTFIVIKLKQYGMPSGLQKVIYIIFAFCPLFPLWGMTVLKDTPFAIGIIFMTVLLLEAFRQPEKFTAKKYILLCIVLFYVMIIRNNGFYLILATFPFVIIHFRKDKKFLVKIGAVLLIPLLVFKIGYTGFLFNSMNILDGSPREMLSVPFQQTARYIDEYGDEITPEEEDAILTILGGQQYSLDDIAKRYVPNRSDTVKITYNRFADTDDLINYFKVWFEQLKKHPDVYIEAFLNLNYNWFCFESDQDNIYYNGITDEVISERFEGLENPSSLKGERTIIKQAVNALSQIPILNCLVEFSFYTWAYVILFIAMLIRKKHKELLAFLPIFANYAVCFLGPVAYMRYAIPMVVCLPIAIYVTFSGKKPDNNYKSNSKENEIWIK